jgi:four helix bundle protein
MKQEIKKKIVKFTDLDAWQEAHKLVLVIYEITREFPKEELSGLSIQMRRVGTSITSNIAEGFSRGFLKEKIQFYSIAQGSVTELQNQLLIARDVGYIAKEKFEKIITQTVKVHKIINGLIKKSRSFLPNSSFLIPKSKGIITVYVLVFGAIFLILLGGLLGFILLQLRQSAQKVAWNQSFHIAEAGINYYRWCLNNEVTENCQTEKDYFDPAGNLIGHFSLEITSQENCGQIIQKRIVSTGWTNNFSDIKRKITTLYAKESVGKYSYLINDNLWVGSDHEIRGPFHSNGGIRFDGENQSIVTSARDSWLCTRSFGCNYLICPSDCIRENLACDCPGVFTTTNVSNPDLFDFPVSPFDFTGITVDLAQMKNIAQSSGIYLPPSNTINPQGKGYHLIFENDGRVEVRIITDLSQTFAYSLEEDWHYDYFTITNEYLYNTYIIPSACSVIFIEDNLWPEGVVKGKIAVASANLINPNLDTDVILERNFDYSVKDGSDGLILLGERNILIGPNSPNIMELRGIFIAQKGRFSRNHYPNNIREKLEIYGSIISNGRVGTKWVSGSQVVSGYLERESYFDRNLIYNPPVFTPNIGSDFKLVDWEEIR